MRYVVLRHFILIIGLILTELIKVWRWGGSCVVNLSH